MYVIYPVEMLRVEGERQMKCTIGLDNTGAGGHWTMDAARTAQGADSSDEPWSLVLQERGN